MAATTTAEGQITIKSTLSLKELVSGITSSSPSAISVIKAIAAGTGADQCNVAYHQLALTLAPDEVLDIDLKGSAQQEQFGNDLNFTILKALVIENISGDAGTVVDVGGDANSVPFLKVAADIVPLKQGSTLAMVNMSATGLAAVTADTGDILQLTNLDSGNSATLNLHIWGVDDS